MELILQLNNFLFNSARLKKIFLNKKFFLFFTIILAAPFLTSAATLSLSPSSGNQTIGATFQVNILLDTQTSSIDGVDIRYLNYNPALLEVQDSDSATANIQITAGNLMPQTIINTVDAVNGLISLSQIINTGGTKFNGSGTLAAINFKVLAAGDAGVNFNFTSGNTTDSNITSNGLDILTSVINGNYTLISTSLTSCATSNLTWQNNSIASQTGTFTAEFDATPNNNLMDGVVGLSSTAATWYTGLATIIRFNTSGNIDARNNSAYSAATIIPYTAGNLYHFRLVINIPNHIYNIYVTPLNSSEVTLGLNYAFRTEQNTVSSLNNWTIYSSAGTHQVCNFQITSQSISDTTPPVISSITASAITSSNATITWTTNEAADSQIDYGLTTSYGTSSSLNTALSTNHSIIISGLSAGTIYNYRVKSKDASGNLATSLNSTFQTTAIADSTAPSAISNLTAVNTTQTSTNLTWTAPGDDGTTGTANSYDIRYSTSSITETNWAQTTQVSGEPIPQLAGNTETYTLVGLTPDTTYFTAIKTSDEIPNTSGLSNVISFKTQPASSQNQTPTDYSVALTSPNGGECLIHGQTVNITWTRNNIDHPALYYTTDGGAATPTFGLWFQMYDSGSTATSYNWIIPSSINSDTVRIWVEGHDSNHSTRLAIDSSDNNVSIKSSCQQNQQTNTNTSTSTSSSTTTSTTSGGGGSFTSFTPSDITPPPQVSDFKTVAGDKQITLNWINPKTSSDWIRTIIIRKENSSIVSPIEGVKIYEGTAETFTDINLENYKTYYYAAFTIDTIPNYSEKVEISASPQPPAVIITNPLPSSSLTNVLIRNLTQQKPDGNLISEGETIYDSIITFSTLLWDVGNNRVKFEIELRKTGEEFTGNPTLSSLYYNSGEIAKIERGGLVTGSYRFKARAKNIKGEISDWLEFGNSSAKDFTVSSAKPTTQTSTSSRTPISFTRTLRIGIKGNDTKQLQEAMNILGYDTGLADGSFGRKTAAGVKTFQSKYGLTADGLFGKKSQTKFNEIYTGQTSVATTTTTIKNEFTRTLLIGSRGNDVKYLQELLNSLGFNVELADGSFGKKTITGVKSFQTKYGLTADGVFGSKSAKKLLEVIK